MKGHTIQFQREKSREFSLRALLCQDERGDKRGDKRGAAGSSIGDFLTVIEGDQTMHKAYPKSLRDGEREVSNLVGCCGPASYGFGCMCDAETIQKILTGRRLEKPFFRVSRHI